MKRTRKTRQHKKKHKTNKRKKKTIGSRHDISSFDAW